MRFGCLLLLCAISLHAQVMRGKVIMADGSAPPQRAIIERECEGNRAGMPEAVAGKNGEFYWNRDNDRMGMKIGMSRSTVLVHCYLRAHIKGLESEAVDLQDPKVIGNLRLPTMVLRPVGARQEGAPLLPPPVLRAWDGAIKAYKTEAFAEAERLAREVTKAAPQFAPAWNAVGLATSAQKKYGDSREAFRKAVAADAASIPYRIQLSRVELTMELWPEASKTAEETVQADAAQKYPEAELNLGIARYMLRDVDGARAHWERFLERAPGSLKAAEVRARLEEMRGGSTPALAVTVPQTLVAAEPEREPEFGAGIEAAIPGGRKALAAMAHLPSVPPAATFFLEYCRAIAAQTSRVNDRPVPLSTETLQEYLAAVAQLVDLGDAKDGRAAFRLSAGDAKTEKALGLMGWRIVERSGRRSVEPGERAVDGSRQLIPRALGIDEMAMKAALEAGGTFEFTVESETAPVAGGAAWNAELRTFPALDGGIAEAFARHPRLARTYAGLASLPPEIAAALVHSVGLRVLGAQHAPALWLYADTFHAAGGAAELPGGPAAAPVWEKLAGASAREPAKFFAALLVVDRGRLAAFYAAIARADETHRRFFTANLARAQKWYAWYRDSEELRDGVGMAPPGWRGAMFASLPLEHERLRLPGGRAAWISGTEASDDRVLLSVDVRALLAVSDLERKRGRPLDMESARLLARNFEAWHSLWPYFEAMPELGAAEFQSLEKFAAVVSARPRAEQEKRMSQWHSGAALIVMGRQAGTLDEAAAARAFGALCRSGEAAVGGPPLGPGLLRLSGERKAAFDRVLELQKGSRDGLAGAVYAAVLDADGLLVNEDRELLRKHVFVPREGELFAPSALAGSHFTGGFVGFEDVARRLAGGGKRAPVLEPAATGGGAADGPETLFHASGRLVEIHATVTDDRGRLLDGLRPDQFAVLDGGRAVSIAAFENGAAPLSCALLLDTSQSMDRTLAAVKSAALRLIGGLRPGDSVAVYSLTSSISELTPFTTDKTAAARAVVRAETGELTALYDGLVRVNRDLAGRTGKKVVVVLTDGDDTASTLSAETAVARAKTAGVPIYTVALGQAIGEAKLLRQLREMSQSTGGSPFAIRTAAEIGPVFDRVLQDLLHGYLLAFSPLGAGNQWRKIEVKLRAGKVRAREGYFPE